MSDRGSPFARNPAFDTLNPQITGNSMPNDDKQRKSLDGRAKRSESALVSVVEIEKSIFLIRAQRVMLDSHLAVLYGVATKTLNKAVNLDRFPDDFMFQLTPDEAKSLRFQFGTLKRGQHSKYLPYAFTEQGVAMLSSVLKSKQAAAVNIAIMRAFVRLREALSLHKDLAHRLHDLERKIANHDESISTLFDAIRHLMTPPQKPQKEIGFHIKEEAIPYRIKRRTSLAENSTKRA